MVATVSVRILTGFYLVLIGCPTEQSPPDTGLPEAGLSDVATPFDAGSSNDAGLRDQGVDAGESGCDGACPQGSVCTVERCVRRRVTVLAVAAERFRHLA